MSKPTIYEIKNTVESNDPSSKFFSPENMKFAGQTVKSFTVVKTDKENVYIYAPRYLGGKPTGYTFREFKDGKLVSVHTSFNTFGEIARFLANN